MIHYGKRLSAAVVLSVLATACSSQKASGSNWNVTDSTADTGDVRACETNCEADAVTGSDAPDMTDFDAPSDVGDSSDSSEIADAGEATDSTDSTDANGSSDAGGPSPWVCPYGQAFGAPSPLPWPFTLTGTERISASGQSVVWRDSGDADAPASPLHIADLAGQGADAGFVKGVDIDGTANCGDFAISPDGLSVLCVTPDGAQLQVSTRAAIGASFEAPDTTVFAGALASVTTVDGGALQLSHPLQPTATTLIFQIQGVGIFASEVLFPGDPWPPASKLTDPGTLALDGAYDTTTLFLWDATASETSIDWLFLDGHWGLSPLGAQTHITPVVGCSGAYYILNSTLEYSTW
jgi:hypothetical protein